VGSSQAAEVVANSDDILMADCRRYLVLSGVGQKRPTFGFGQNGYGQVFRPLNLPVSRLIGVVAGNGGGLNRSMHRS
jgi:hypothetical protein